MAAVTGSEGGGNYGRLKGGYWGVGGDHWGSMAQEKEGGGVHGAAAREEEEAALGRCGEGGRRLGGPCGRKAEQVSSLLGRLG
jgi:hypothetical protein